MCSGMLFLEGGDNQTIGLLIADEVPMVGGEVGPTYEVVMSRTRYVERQTGNKTLSQMRKTLESG